MSYFLLVYDRRQQRLLSERVFAEHRQALRSRFSEERRRSGEADVEVVVIGAGSREDLQRTHARYFRSPRDLAGDLAGSVSER